MMRIMEIVSGRDVNGAAANCLEIVRALQRRGHQMTVVCRPKSWITQQLADSDVAVVESDLHRWPTDELSRVAKIVREQRIDVVHTHMSSANFFGVLLRRLFGVPACVASAHNRYIQLHWMFNDRVIAVSEATRRFHCRYNRVRSSRVDVVRNFIDDRRFHGVAPEHAVQLRRDLSLGSESRVIGVVGDCIARKGLIYLIRALPRIAAVIPNVHLLCVGHNSNDYAVACREEAERLRVESLVTWAGARSDIDVVLAALDVYALPSLEDNMPLAILEAMASGRPVVATHVGGIPECVEDGQTGLLVPPAAESPLAEALIRILSDPRLGERLGEAGRQKVRKQFSVDSQIVRIEQSLRRAAA